MITSSRITSLALVSLLLSTQAMIASAGDLGEGCCADLEERIAEIEATAARKGNRVVSLQVYGQVNKALLFFDDGFENDTFVVDHDGSSSRLGFLGKAHIKGGLSVGYNMELDVQDAATNRVTQVNDEGVENEILIRKNYVYIDSEQFGRVSLGQQSAASDGISQVVLANPLGDSSTIYGGFGVTVNGVDSGLNVSDLIDDLDGPRADVIRYDTPSIHGFILSASWGENDFYDITLRFKKDWNTIRIGAGIGFTRNSEFSQSLRDFTDGELLSVAGERDTLSGSASALHIPTGLYIAASAGSVDFRNLVLTDPDQSVRTLDVDGSFWYVQAGIEKRFFSFGTTTLYGEYGEYENVTALQAGLLDTTTTRWGFGAVQTIDSAAMDLYANVRFYDFDLMDAGALDDGELTAVLIGSRIKF